jgi:fumarylacetoacetase
MPSTWIDVPSSSDFSIHNFPFGIFSCPSSEKPQRRCGTILGETVIDLSVLEEADLFMDIPQLKYNVFNQPSLNAYLEHPRSVWLMVRQRLIDLFTIETPSSLDLLRGNIPLQKAACFRFENVQLHLPIDIGDYSDFYSSREHATNVGTMFRGPANALQPNWLHLPVGYHGRSSTVCITGTPVYRPCGQLQLEDSAKDAPPKSTYGPSRALDFELEVATVVGGPTNEIGTPLTLQQAKDRIFGFVLMNDWSARDVQKWEYVPLGPFTSKNFCTTISPWIVMKEALDAIPTSATAQNDPVPLPYLQDADYSSYDIALSVSIQGSNQVSGRTVCNTNFRHLYWNSAQQLVHHAVSGCSMRAGDLLGSGTISGSTDTSYGSMLELSWNSTKSVLIGDDEVRTFLQDGDTVTLKGSCTKSDGALIGFGECSGTIFPPRLIAAHEIAGPSPTCEVSIVRDRYSDFTLYGYWRSSSTWRVRIALAAKAISYETIPINLFEMEHKSDDFRSKNPLALVPLLEFTDISTGERIRLSQSLAIIAFLDEAFPYRKSLLPSDAMEKAAALAVAETINSGIQPWQNVFFLGELAGQSEGKIDSLSVAKTVNERGLRTVEEMLRSYRLQFPSTRGPYCMGTFSPTVVDACVVPQLYNARRFGVDVDEACPTLVAIEALCSQHPWFQQSYPNSQPDAPNEKE